MRVTEVSDTNAVLHACLAQAFFCLLLLIAMLSAKSFGQTEHGMLGADIGGDAFCRCTDGMV